MRKQAEIEQQKVTSSYLNGGQKTEMVWTCPDKGRRKIVKSYYLSFRKEEKRYTYYCLEDGVCGMAGEMRFPEEWIDRENWRQKITEKLKWLLEKVKTL